ncbi:hypothetical protein [Paraburkholderia hospita]|uniref:hypothetical protein n=1 Tax=Paraburkholderia hospita TaxID=169430 RepID=UPI000B3487DB|nr:hypothetical protein [Paraburkholderia hospita]OUL71618.1 hypothetical protein CA603_46800 [Paraburkholderia hospita]
MFKSLFSNNHDNATQDAFARALEAASKLDVKPIQPRLNENPQYLTADYMLDSLQKWAATNAKAVKYEGPAAAELMAKITELQRGSATLRSEIAKGELTFITANGGREAMQQLLSAGIEIPGFTEFRAKQSANTVKMQLCDGEIKRLQEEVSADRAHTRAMNEAAKLLAAIAAAFN